ncbi:hypothetical protein [Shimia abyssi]|uniref:Uncharacterized protein n=1 Tax=Shimia abyssi TaxID=1662395 RepID=A0A2P8EX64_9RHOB|nr:hypothetical protein [Shimia abyssi]PSL14061.1 hypothetical protein CLV88_13016 [Shimia abyssi]
MINLDSVPSENDYLAVGAFFIADIIQFSGLTRADFANVAVRSSIAAYF